MQNGYPLFNYEASGTKKYNELLVDEYLDRKNYLNEFLKDQICSVLRKRVNDIESIDFIN